MTEQVIQSKIIKALEKEGAYVVKVVSASKKGVPDLLVCFEGRFMGVEVKRPSTKNNTSELQKYNLECITNSGGLAIVATCVEDVLNAII
jgi:Holliday junction resolvase